ncbi:MAG: TerC family protein, partial [Brevundimonas sp.]
LIADGFGVHVPKGYIYAAMAFSALVEGLNMLSRRSSQRKAAAEQARQAELNKAETAEPGV